MKFAQFRAERFRQVRSGCLTALAAWALLSGGEANAGVYGVGKITQLVVGRLQTQVFIEVEGGTQSDWPCSSTNPNGLNYAFDMNRPDAQALLSALVTAFASRSTITVIGTGTCTVAPDMEDVSYVWLVNRT